MERKRKTRDKWISAVLSILLPGTGHMYLGFIGLGLGIMCALFVNIALIVALVVLGIYIVFPISIALVTFFGLMIPVIYFYGIFDALQKVEKKYASSELFASDAVLHSPTDRDSEWPDEVYDTRYSEGSHWAGIALMALGVVLLINFLLPNPVLDWLFRHFQTLVAVLLLLSGVWLIWQQLRRGRGDRI